MGGLGKEREEYIDLRLEIPDRRRHAMSLLESFVDNSDKHADCCDRIMRAQQYKRYRSFVTDLDLRMDLHFRLCWYLPR